MDSTNPPRLGYRGEGIMSGTCSSRRNAEELSMTTAPALTAALANFLLMESVSNIVTQAQVRVSEDNSVSLK
jgi:hypothetical protein